MDPKGNIGHWSVRTKFTKEESEEPKGAQHEKQEKQLEVDEATPHEASAQGQSPQRTVIRVRRNTRLRAGDSGNQPGRSRGDGLCAKRTIDAVKRPSDTCRQHQWLLNKVENPAQSICVSSATMKKLVQQGKQPLKLWQWKGVVEKKAHRGRQWKVFGSEQFLRGMWGYFTLNRADARKMNSSERYFGKARSVATGASIPGTNQEKCGYRLRSPDNPPYLHRNETWQLGDFCRRTQEGRKAL